MSSRTVAVAHLHSQIEEALAHRFPGALTPRVRATPQRLTTGIEAMDALLSGGLPLGGLTELAGPECSGRTTLATSVLAGITARGSCAAWVDSGDSFDPTSAAQCGVELSRMLWVRCGEPYRQATATVEPMLPARIDVPATQRVAKGGGSPHPRMEADGMPEALASLLQKHPGAAAAIPDKRARRMIGTPSAPNRPLMPFPASSPYREEQVATDRVPSRREEHFRKFEELQKSGGKAERPVFAWKPATPATPAVRGTQKQVRKQHWDALDKALRATDLVLQAGGFRLMVLDLGSVDAEMGLRIPLSTWFRFRAACERTQTTMVVLTRHPCAKSSADLLVRLQPGEEVAEGNVMTALRFQAAVERERSALPDTHCTIPFRKPASAERAGAWSAQAPWGLRA